MPGEPLKPTKGTTRNATTAADVWAREAMQKHLRELNCACQDRTPGALQSIDNRREKRSVVAHETRMTRKMEAFDRKMMSVGPKAKTF